jgi:heme a synthase
MVKSGLDPKIVEERKEPRVSQYRLSAHLASALALYVISLKTGIRILYRPSSISVRPPIHFLNSLIIATALSGSLVAGLDAGMIYNNFPKMGLNWFPSDGWIGTLGWRNIFENPSTVQFIHRFLAISTVISTSWVFFQWRKRIPADPLVLRLLGALAAFSWGQACLGISTLLLTVPVPLASAHQAGSLVLIGLGTSLLAKMPVRQSKSFLKMVF